MKRVTLAVVLAAVGIGMAVAWDPAFSPASCGDCPTDFTLYGSVGTDLALGGGAYACPWICQCAKTNSDGSRDCFSCSNGADSNIEVIAFFTGKDTNLVSSALDTAQTAMSGWISNRMAEVMEVVHSCTTEERREKTSEERLDEESLGEARSYPAPPPTPLVSLGLRLSATHYSVSSGGGPGSPNPPSPPAMNMPVGLHILGCGEYNLDVEYGSAKVDEWHANNLGTADVWGLGSPKTYKELMEDELNNDPGFTGSTKVWDITWDVTVVDNKYIQVRRHGVAGCMPTSTSCTTACMDEAGSNQDCMQYGIIMYYAYLSKYEGSITSSSGDLVFTKVASIANKRPPPTLHQDCTSSSSADAIDAKVNMYLEAGEPVIKQALNKVRFQVLKDMTSGT